MSAYLDSAGPWLVFTDLDGTLLEWSTYSPAIARPALLRLRERGIPVIFCSSKTAVEQRALRRQLGIRAIPSIVENGAALVVPDSAGLPTGGWPAAPGEPGRRVCVLGLPVAEVRRRLDRVRARTGLALRGYREIDAEELAGLAGLETEAAARALQRDYSETLVDPLDAGTWAALDEAFAAEGLECRHGGRFRTVTGAGTDKGRAVRRVVELYAQAYGRSVRSFGLGDSANDLPMLAAVDSPVLVAREDGTWADVALAGLRREPGRGPHGWVATVDAMLQDTAESGAA